MTKIEIQTLSYLEIQAMSFCIKKTFPCQFLPEMILDNKTKDFYYID